MQYFMHTSKLKWYFFAFAFLPFLFLPGTGNPIRRKILCVDTGCSKTVSGFFKIFLKTF